MTFNEMNKSSFFSLFLYLSFAMASPLELKCCNFKKPVKPLLWCGKEYDTNQSREYAHGGCKACLTCGYAREKDNDLRNTINSRYYDRPGQREQRIEATFTSEEDKKLAQDFHDAERKVVELKALYDKQLVAQTLSLKRALSDTLPSQLETFKKTACCDRCKKKRKKAADGK